MNVSAPLGLPGTLRHHTWWAQQHDYGQGVMDVDTDAKNQIMDLADLLHTFGCWIEAREMELWGCRLQDTLRAPEVH